MNGDNSTHKLAVDCIYEALVKLMETKPYKEITITDITKKAGFSRMAYYRNYQDKDDILIDHLRERLEQLSEGFLQKKDPSDEEFWRELVLAVDEDPINEHVIKAGLLDRGLQIFLEYGMRIYREGFGLDLSDERVMMNLYHKLGALFGYMVYMIDRKDKMNRDDFICQLRTLLKEGEIPMIRG